MTGERNARLNEVKRDEREIRIASGPGLRVIVARDAGTAAAAAAREIEEAIAAALIARGRAHVALAGGETPRAAYELLARRLDSWETLDLWFGDERCVDADDPGSNYGMVRGTLLAPAPARAARVHRILGELGPEEAARRYDGELREHAPRGGDGLPVLDVALLGLGEDGHTASLFPHDPRLSEPTAELALPVHGAPKPPPERVTLSLQVLRAARRVIVLAPGAGKAQAIAALRRGLDPAVPASLLVGPNMQLIVDEEALVVDSEGAVGR